MAKRIVDEDLRFNVIINGNEAQSQLYKLEQRNRSLTDANKNLRAERSKLEAQGKKNSKAWKQLSTQITANNKELKQNRSEMRRLQDEIGITGLTLRQLGKKASFLRLQLANMLPNDPNRKKLKADLIAINRQMDKMSVKASMAQSGISKLAMGFNKYFALGASVIATGAGIVLSLQKMIDYNGKLSDAQSDVQKTTGLTKKEVDELTKSFGALKTRTARVELLELAEEAGRLGIEGAKNVQDFVNTANELKVALGDDLSTEQIREVGKMAKVYGVAAKNNLTYAESFQAIGSAINEVSASGENQAGFLVDYLKRTAGISKQANISAEQNIGFAATFDEIGTSVEIAGTAMNKVLLDMFENSKEYAKIAGMSEKAFNTLLQSDANEAVIKFLEGLNKGGEGLAPMVKRLDEIDVGGTRGKAALTALAGATDLLRTKQLLAADALKLNISLTDEYKLKNNNLAASIKKIQKRLIGTFTSERVVKGLTNFVEWFAKFIGASEDADGKVTRFRNRLVNLLKTIIIITAAVLAYRTATKLTALWTNNAYQATKLYNLILKITSVTTNVLKGGTLLLKAAYYLVTGQIKKAAAAMRLFNMITKLSPIGLILGLVAALGTAYLLFSENSKKAYSAQKQMNDAIKDANIQTAAEENALRQLLKVAQDETRTKQERQKAIDELNKKVPEYNNNLSLEAINTKEASKQLDTYIEKIKAAAREKFFKSLVDKKAEELAAAEASSLEDNLNWWDKTVVTVKSFGSLSLQAVNSTQRALKNQAETVAKLNQELENANKNYQKQKELNGDSGSKPDGPNEGDTQVINGITFIFKNGKWKALKPIGGGGSGGNKKKITQAKKEAEALLKLQRDTEDNRIALINDAFEREMKQAEANHRRKIEDLKAKLISQSEIDKATNAGNTDLAAIYTKQNSEIQAQILQQEQLHQQSLNKILDSGIQDHINKQIKQFNREQQERLTAHNNELAALGENEEAKKELSDKFNKEQLEREKGNQQLLINELQKILSNAEFEGFNIELLSDEQLKAIKDRLASLGFSISEINVLLAKMQGKDGDELGFADGGAVDVLGFTQEQWEQIFANTDLLSTKIAQIGSILQASAQAYSMYDKFVSSSENKRLQKLERETQKGVEKQKRLLDNGLITKKQHDDAVKAMEDKLNKKKAETEYKQAKRQKQINIATILGNQAVAVSKALAQGGFVLGLPWAGIVAALAGIQLAMAVAQPLPAKGFESGYYNKFPVQREQDGKVFNAAFGGDSRSGIVDKPTVFLAGEGGKNFPEMIIDGRTLKQFDPELKNRLYNELSRVRGFETGFYKENTNQSTNSGFDAGLLNETLTRTNQLLNTLEKEGVIAYISKRPKDIKNISEEIDKHKTRIKKNEL